MIRRWWVEVGIAAFVVGLLYGTTDQRERHPQLRAGSRVTFNLLGVPTPFRVTQVTSAVGYTSVELEDEKSVTDRNTYRPGGQA